MRGHAGLSSVSRTPRGGTCRWGLETGRPLPTARLALHLRPARRALRGAGRPSDAPPLPREGRVFRPVPRRNAEEMGQLERT